MSLQILSIIQPQSECLRSPDIPEADLTEQIQRAPEMCNCASEGDLEARILDIDSESPLVGLYDAVNRMLDIADSYVRESATAMDHCSQSEFYRPILLRG